jgi:L-rhamnose isomerase
MNKKIVENYEHAKSVYKIYGVDTDKVLALFEQIPVSLHCWNGDDIKGFEGLGEVESQNLVTGNYPYPARNGDELRADIEMAFSLSPSRQKVNLHSMYAERQNPRNDLTIEDFQLWVDWAKKNNYGLDFNTSFFTHPMMNKGFSLASLDKATRDYWIKAGIDSRKISLAIGKELGQKCYNNFWIPDGLKDIPANRLRYRELLTDSLDQIFAHKYTEEERKYTADVLEGKLFGIGTESFVVGSHDYYLAYAIKNGVGVCMDTGHYHPTESVADKLSAVRPFINDLMLHVTRSVRWDSDHVVLQDDELLSVMKELKRGNFYDKIAIGLDFFDATINRVAAWAIGLRATAKAILTSLLEPTHLIDEAELNGDFTERLFLMDEFENLPVNAVWEYILESKGIPIGIEALKKVQRYEKEELTKRS